MKIFLTLLLSFTTAAQAQDLASLLRSLNSPANALTCERETPTPIDCSDLFVSLCRDVQSEQSSGAIMDRILEKADASYKAYVDVLGEARPQLFTRNKYARGRDQLYLSRFQDSPDVLLRAFQAAENSALQSANMSAGDIENLFSVVKADLLAAIDNMNLPDGKKSDLKKRIENSVYADSEKTAAFIGRHIRGRNPGTNIQDTELAHHSVVVYSTTCGPAGESEQAVSANGEFIHFCPGYLIANSYLGREELIGNLYATMAHELGHSLAEDASVYEELKSCYEKNIGIPGYDRLTSDERGRLWQNQSKEIISDSWANLAYQEGLKRESCTPAISQQRLMGMIKVYCHMSDQPEDPSSTHPSPRLRTEIIIRDAEFRRSLGCGPLPETVPRCLLK